MARSFHRKRSLEPNSELNVTALIDLGFALLIIFMISTPLIEKEQVMEVDLPTSGQSSEEPSSESVDITVLKDGYRVDGNLVNGPDLERELANFATMSKAPVISIRGDAETPYQRIMNLMDLLKEYELGKIHFVTKNDE